MVRSSLNCNPVTITETLIIHWLCLHATLLCTNKPLAFLDSEYIRVQRRKKGGTSVVIFGMLAGYILRKPSPFSVAGLLLLQPFDRILLSLLSSPEHHT